MVALPSCQRQLDQLYRSEYFCQGFGAYSAAQRQQGRSELQDLWTRAGARSTQKCKQAGDVTDPTFFTGTATSVNPMSHLLPPESTLITASFGKVLHHAACAFLVLMSLPAILGTITSCCQQHEQALGKTCIDTEPCVTRSLAAICGVVVPA